jgi:hypothetical protein
MKKCPYCGTDYPDNLLICPADQQPLQTLGAAPTASISSPAIARRDPSPTEEARFWERMTFRQFAVLFIRIQALWLIFEGILDITNMFSYLPRLRGILFPTTPAYASLRETLFFMTLRLVLHIATALICIVYAERILSWLVKNMIPNPLPPSPSNPPTTAALDPQKP